MKKIILSLIALSSIVATNAQDKKELNVKYRNSVIQLSVGYLF